MKRNNLLGRKFGRLTVIAEAEPRVSESGRKSRWKCLCECGNYVIADGSNLCTGHTRSCGCLSIEVSSRIGSNKEIREKINAAKASKPKVKRSYRQSYTIALENGTLVDDSYSVYKHTNLVNGKIYIGITRRAPQDRWGKDGCNYKTSGNIHFSSAIEKYGWDNFSHEVLFAGLSKKEAESKEVELIAAYKTTDPNFGYNIQNGGNSIGRMTDEIKQKISKANTGKTRTDEAKQRMREAALKRTEDQRKYSYKRVMCIETGEVYKSITYAGQILNVCTSNISRSCKKNMACGGVHFCYV